MKRFQDLKVGTRIAVASALVAVCGALLLAANLVGQSQTIGAITDIQNADAHVGVLQAARLQMVDHADAQALREVQVSADRRPSATEARRPDRHPSQRRPGATEGGQVGDGRNRAQAERREVAHLPEPVDAQREDGVREVRQSGRVDPVGFEQTTHDARLDVGMRPEDDRERVVVTIVFRPVHRRTPF